MIRLGYTVYNFDTHTPMYLTRKRVFDAYGDLRDFVTEDPLYGLIGPTAVLNHVYRNEPMELVSLSEENLSFGYWGASPTYETVVNDSNEKTFFNFDGRGFGEGVKRFLSERFATPCKFEKS